MIKENKLPLIIAIFLAFICFVAATVLSSCSSSPAKADEAFDFECHPVRITDTVDSRCENNEAICYILGHAQIMSCIKKGE